VQIHYFLEKCSFGISTLNVVTPEVEAFASPTTGPIEALSISASFTTGAILYGTLYAEGGKAVELG
jgi:hypothetical protein